VKQFFLTLLLQTFLSFTLYSAENQAVKSSPHPVEKNHVHSQSVMELDSIVKGNNLFALDLYWQFKNRKGNLFFSPYSISMALVLALAGAQGETAIEMQKVLQLPIGFFPLEGDLMRQLQTPTKAKPNQVELLMANSIWMQKGLPLLPSYQLALKNIYNTQVETVDFKVEPWNALKVINQWVSNRTKGKISQLMTRRDISMETQLILTSAIYLKAPWMHAFNHRQTERAPFYSIGGRSVSALMMKSSDDYLLFKGPQFTMIELPYWNEMEKGPQLSMIILLPDEEIGLDRIEDELTVDNWLSWIKKLEMRKVIVNFPKFRIEDRVELDPLLKQLGMIKAFSPLADFSGMTGKKNLFIQAAVHQTFIHVDEEGTEAAAVTAISMAPTAVDSTEPYHFIANRPFLFVIIDRQTHSILFMGRVLQP
jgi:serine protease inhibitor